MTAGTIVQAYSDSSPDLEQAHFKCLHELFEEQVACTPNAIAVDFQQQPVTYADLNRRANQIAHYLRKRGVGREVRVGICLDRSPEMVITVLALLKAGGTYVPLATDHPPERQSYVLRDAGVPLAVVSGARRFPAGTENIATLDLQTEWAAIAAESSENLGIDVDARTSAYIIYTSGTTGHPKGVIVEHVGLSNLAAAQRELFGVRPEDRVLQFASLSFDASIFEILMAFCAGATLVLGRPEELMPGPDLVNFIRSRQITQITIPPSVLGSLPETEFPSLSTVIVAGETCSQDLAKRWGQGRRFFNAYGPTEATVWASLEESRPDQGEPTIGRPIKNAIIHILDGQGIPVPPGTVGELYIGGIGVARGCIAQVILLVTGLTGG